MRFTEVFVRRPVLSIVISLLLLVAGVRAGLSLPVLAYPQTVSGTIQIATAYYGADAATVAGFITTPIETAISQTQGVDYIQSQSQTGQSTITLYLRLNQDPDRALSEVQANVAAVANQLPPGSQASVITLLNNATFLMGISVTSHTMPPERVADYVTRVMAPQLQAVPGVLLAQSQGAGNLALRIWLQPDRLSAYGLTATDVYNALAANDYVTGVGTTLGAMTYANLAVTSGLHSPAEFRQLVVRQANGALVRLGDVAEVAYGSDVTSENMADNFGPGLFLAVNGTPGGNLITTSRDLRVAFARMKAALPPGIAASIMFDQAIGLNASRHEVLRSLAAALGIVSLVVFLFLGSFRAVLIPVVTIPLSLIGTLALMSVFGFSINELTLLALVLAIGLVVDDAIIIVENVSRHLAEGMAPAAAAMRAGRELGSPIIAMTAVLVAAYVPVGLQKGLTGALFTEFAVTLAASVTVSAALALTLSPMMCAGMLRPHAGGGRILVRLGDRAMAAMQRVYLRLLGGVLRVWPVAILVACLVVGASVVMFRGAAHELAPQEDGGFIILAATAPPSATLDQIRLYDPQIERIIRDLPEMRAFWIGDQPGSINDGIVLKEWDERRRNTTVVQNALQAAATGVAGLQLDAFQPPALPGAGQGLPIQFVLKGAGSVEQLAAASDRMLVDARASGLFAFVDKDLKIDQPQTTIELDRAKIGALGLNVTSVGNTLNWLLGGGFVNYFSLQQRSYKVIPMVVRDRRLTSDQILDLPVASIDGVPVPLGAVAHLSRQVVPEEIVHFQQLTATTLSAIPRPGVSTAAAYGYLQGLAARDLPGGFAFDTAGPLREYVQTEGSFLPNFGFAMVIIFLALAALFESFRDPLVILVSVPMSIAGALFFVWLGVGGASVNLYSEIGFVTLAGLISKHGILIVEVANEQQRLGRSKRQAVEIAAGLRLRPILMTTAAMVLGVMPLVFASGAGAAARYVMGLVIASGLAVGTVFTLFLVPAVYLLVAAQHDRPAARRESVRADELVG